MTTSRPTTVEEDKLESSRVRPIPARHPAYDAWINANRGLPCASKTSKITSSPSSTNRYAPSDESYHILITSSHLTKDPTQQIEKLRIIGTYDSLPLAKAAAHRALFDAGYEAEFFKAYGVTTDFFDECHIPMLNRDGLLVHACAQDGTIFQVRIATTPKNSKLAHEFEDGRVCKELYYVVQTTVNYRDGAEGENWRMHNIEGVCDSYEEARKMALGVLLDESDGITRQSYAQYDEVAADATDCGYGENVLVHAMGLNGENSLVSVVKGQVLESVRLMEASMRIR